MMTVHVTVKKAVKTHLSCLFNSVGEKGRLENFRVQLSQVPSQAVLLGRGCCPHLPGSSPILLIAQNVLNKMSLCELASGAHS